MPSESTDSLYANAISAFERGGAQKALQASHRLEVLQPGLDRALAAFLTLQPGFEGVVAELNSLVADCQPDNAYNLAQENLVKAAESGTAEWDILDVRFRPGGDERQVIVHVGAKARMPEVPPPSEVNLPDNPLPVYFEFEASTVGSSVNAKSYWTIDEGGNSFLQSATRPLSAASPEEVLDAFRQVCFSPEVWEAA